MNSSWAWAAWASRYQRPITGLKPTNFHSNLEGCPTTEEILLGGWRENFSSYARFLRRGSCGFTSGGPLCAVLFRPPCDKKFKASLRLTLANISIITSTLFTNRFLSFNNTLNFFVINNCLTSFWKAIFCPSSVAAVPEIFNNIQAIWHAALPAPPPA